MAVSRSNNQTAFHKVNDWYSKHNFGTRFAMIIFILLYVIVVLSNVDFSPASDPETTKVVVENTILVSNLELVKITGYFAFAAFLVITLGDNAVSKIGDIIVKIKGTKKA